VPSPFLQIGTSFVIQANTALLLFKETGAFDKMLSNQYASCLIMPQTNAVIEFEQ
jgi:hypothetical protein